MIPSGSIEEALEYFKTAENLRTTPWKENRVFLARCYIQQANYKEAIRWIEEAIPIPVINLEVIFFIRITDSCSKLFLLISGSNSSERTAESTAQIR